MEKWFATRRRTKILELAYRQITLSIDTVADLERAVRDASKKKGEEAKKSIERLFATEVEIDNLRRTVFEESTRGNLPAKDREDLMHLVKRLDVMADHVKDSARSVLILLETEVPEEIWESYVKIVENLVKCASTLRKAIEKLGIQPLEAKKLAQEVDKIEGVIDEEYLNSKSLLIKYGSKIDSATLLILKDLLESMENVADTCDDTADYVRVLAVSRESL